MAAPPNPSPASSMTPNLDTSDNEEDTTLLVGKPAPIVEPHVKVRTAATPRPRPSSHSPTPAARRRGCCPPNPITLVYLIVATNGVALSAPSVFLPKMLEKLFHYDPESIGTPVGALQGCYSGGMFLSSFYMGHLSDVHGRKPLLLLGMGVGGVLLSLFGFSPTLGWAAANRLVEGLLNAIIPVSKAYLTDLTPPGAARQMAFAYFGAAFSLARALSSAMTGFVYEMSPKDTMWEFAIPCFFAASPLIIMWFATLVFLPRQPKSVDATAAPGDVELTRLTGEDEKRGPEPDAVLSPAPQTPATPGPHASLWSRIKSVVRDRDTALLITIYSVNSFTNGSVLIGVILILTLPVEEYGMGQSPAVMGFVLFMFGVVASVFQFTCYRRVMAWLKPVDIYSMLGVPSLGGGTLLLPVAALPLAWSCVDGGDGLECSPSAGAKVLSWVILTIAISAIAIGFMLCLPLVHLMLANVARDSQQGLTQGLAQSCAALLRGVGPFASGVMFSAFAHSGSPFWLYAILGAGYGISGTMSLWLNRSRVE